MHQAEGCCRASRKKLGGVAEQTSGDGAGLEGEKRRLEPDAAYTQDAGRRRGAREDVCSAVEAQRAAAVRQDREGLAAAEVTQQRWRRIATLEEQGQRRDKRTVHGIA